MKRLAPTLSLLALAGMASAEVVSDDAVKLTIGALFQPRMDIGRGSSVAGSGSHSTYAPSEGAGTAAAGAEPDDADFYFRRMRIGIKGTFQTDWVFQATLNADQLGKNTGTSSNGAVNVTFYDAFAGRKFAMGSVAHTVLAGKQPIWANSAAFRGPTGLFPTSRASGALFRYNGTGVAYRLDSSIVRAGIDVQNNGAGSTAGSGDEQASQTEDYGEGLMFAGRVELTGPGEWSAPFQESYAGKPGKGFVVGLDLGTNERDRGLDTDPNTAGVQAGNMDTVLYGIEGVFHLDGLSVLAEYRNTVTTANPDNATDRSKVRAMVALIQAGYAFPLGSTGCNIEPAIRAERIDNNADETGATNWGGDEFGASGRQFEIGVNVYFGAGHKNKLGIEYIRWVGEDVATTTDSDPATANILRVQHQLWF